MKVLIPASAEHHGAVGHARQVAALVAAAGVEVVSTGRADVAHVQFTDGLWGATIDAAATAFERWVTKAAMPVVATLHDVPGSDPDAARDARRSAGYVRVARACDAIIVSSRHEAAKVHRLCGRRARFIELPIPRFDPPVSATALRFDWAQDATLGLLGFLYPGKGHAAAIDAAARQASVPSVVSLGAVSPGHDALFHQLMDRADRQGVRFVVTGALPEATMAAAAAAVAIPLAPNVVVSASASLLAWLGCRRRPIVARGDYSREISERYPGQIELYGSDEALDCVIGQAIADPCRTRLDAVARWPDVGAQHLQAYRELLDAAKMARA